MQIYKADWLNTKPVFYNTKTLKVSHNINDVIDFSDVQLDPEGFNNYLNFGYSVFEQTPVKYVKFLPPCSRILIKRGKLAIKKLRDPIKTWDWKSVDEKEVIKFIQAKVKKWEDSVKGPIIIPTSGGYDSRFLNCLVKDKKKIHAFTYGLSKDQSKSYEVVYAKQLAKQFGIHWKQISLGNFHNYFNDWDRIFGPSVHAHGMYQIEFYQKIRSLLGKGGSVLSGIFGDIWSGNFSFQKITKPKDIYKLAYTHGLHSNSKYSLLKSNNTLLKQYWKENKMYFQIHEYQVIGLIRMKMMLIHYLLEVPRSLGFSAWSPFIDKDVVHKILCLSIPKRKNRLWQKDYFRSNKISFEESSLPKETSNTLNFQAILSVPLKPLDVDLLSEFMNKRYIEQINRRIAGRKTFKIKQFLQVVIEKIGIYHIMHLLGIPAIYGNESNDGKMYAAYLTLKPIELLLQKRTNI